ncbi:MAG: sodium:solute symporter [Flavobacteriales bacterium]|nr:sodium:solute symporter [Flavobacteriales bacterium]
MSPSLILSIVAIYFVVLFVIGKITSKGADNNSFFIGNKQSPWWIVAFGMIGTSLSGVTFISVPGWVGTSQFSYMQMVLGYLVGYTVIATVLMPLYYRLNLTSIYTYLEDRFGTASYKTGASFFLLSRTIGASFRLYLVAGVLQLTIFDAWGIPFIATVIGTIVFIWLYTAEGGIKTIIWTDTLQTLFMLLAVVLTVGIISQELGFGFSEMVSTIKESDYSKIFFFDDPNQPKFFVKQFLAGAFIAIVMTGLDQDMMQKNLSCKNIGEAQKNMFTFSIVLVFVNLFFLALGALLYIYSNAKGIAIPDKTDNLYALLATSGELPVIVGVLFILGLVAAAYSSADSALAALTTSACVDILDIEKKPEQDRVKLRKQVHVLMSGLLVLTIMIFRWVNDESVISAVFRVAGYTYGPLLGLYAFGLFTKVKVRDRLVPIVCLASPVLTYIINANSEAWLGGYKFGFELLILNGALTFVGLLLVSKKSELKLA